MRADHEGGSLVGTPDAILSLRNTRYTTSGPPSRTANRYLVLFAGANGPARRVVGTIEEAEAVASTYPGARVVPVAGRGPGRGAE